MAHGGRLPPIVKSYIPAPENMGNEPWATALLQQLPDSLSKRACHPRTGLI
jgi:hypothetical protein